MSTSLAGFNAATVDPNFGGAGFLPVSDDKGWLVILAADNGFKPSSSGEGMFLELVIKAQDGAIAGKEGVLRLNLQHNKPAAVQAAQAQLSALCHVVGVLNPNTTLDLMNRPFRVVSELQDPKKPEGYTQLANNGIRDVNGNKPGKSGQGPTSPSTSQQMPAGPNPGAQGGFAPNPGQQQQPAAGGFVQGNVQGGGFTPNPAQGGFAQGGQSQGGGFGQQQQPAQSGWGVPAQGGQVQNPVQGGAPGWTQG